MTLEELKEPCKEFGGFLAVAEQHLDEIDFIVQLAHTGAPTVSSDVLLMDSSDPAKGCGMVNLFNLIERKKE